MDKGKIPINKKYELEYHYHDRNADYKYFNRRFEVYLLEKKALKPHYIMHMDNNDIRYMAPGVYKASQKKRYDFGVTTLNWNDIKNTFLDFVVDEIGEEYRDAAKKAIGRLSSPKM